MAASHSSVGQGSGAEPTVVRIIDHNRNPEIWCNWDMVELSDGSQKARCKFCGILLAKESNSNLKKHVNKPFCKALKKDPESQQSQMDSEGGIFSYDFDRVQDRMAKFVIQEALPFNHFDNPRLTSMIRETLQPRYNHVSRHTLRRYCLKMWVKAREELISYFENLNTGVNLTSDVWSAPHGLPESYICVTAHWVDPSSWKMMKRTIAFELFQYPHTGELLFAILDYVMTMFKLEFKVFSMAFDNASNNTNAVDRLRLKYEPVCNGAFFHSRCVAHIINLVVQDGLEVPEVESFMNQYRIMIHDVFKKSRKRHMDYRKLCKDTGRLYLGANWDVPTRWNSTCKMLESGLRQKDTLQMFHNSLSENGKAVEFPDSAWQAVNDIVEFLDVFKNATTKLSGTYYPTSPLVLSELYLMATNFKNFEYRGELFVKMIKPMLSKFKKYFFDIPPVFTCAAALNPILNVAGVECLIDEIYENLDLHENDPNASNEAKKNFNTCFKNMYDFYLKKYGPTIQMPTTSGASSSSSAPRARDPMVSLLNTVRQATAKRQRGNTPSSELGRYSGTDYSSTMDAEEFSNFDILAWWKAKESEFPILATMARDLLTVQASTVASESAFSLSGRVLSLRRTKLTPEAVEMCICLKDHLDAIDRIQDQTTLEEEIVLETKIHDEEVDEGLSPGLSDEELAFDSQN